MHRLVREDDGGAVAAEAVAGVAAEAVERPQVLAGRPISAATTPRRRSSAVGSLRGRDRPTRWIPGLGEPAGRCLKQRGGADSFAQRRPRGTGGPARWQSPIASAQQGVARCSGWRPRFSSARAVIEPRRTPFTSRKRGDPGGAELAEGRPLAERAGRPPTNRSRDPHSPRHAAAACESDIRVDQFADHAFSDVLDARDAVRWHQFRPLLLGRGRSLRPP